MSIADRTASLAAARIVTDLVEHGGGTYERGTYQPFEPTVGFAVGLGGIRLPAGIVDGEKALWAMKAVGGEYDTSYVGTWLDGGIVHFDAVRYFGAERQQAAIRCAIDHDQLALYDFGQQREVRVGQVEFEQ